jgi:asparagine synthase (glutamine-hydrolysing)
MCGIFGTVNYKIALEKVTPYLIHRGPDAQTTVSHDNVQLHHFRLAILDLEGGYQPMEIDNYSIIFNGEFYNHSAVRKQLNLQCETSSDTETFLRAYQKIGIKCLSYFDGMFAIALYDKQKKQLLLFRDRAGKKPLYLYRKDNTLVFSSELNALSKCIALDIDHSNIDLWLKGTSFGSRTPYSNVEEVKPGTVLKVNCNNLSIEETEFWNITKFYKKESICSFEEAYDKIDSSLRSAIKDRLESSDLEVGTFLSGGIDSGLVTSIASEYNSTIKAFTIAFDGGTYDESSLAALVAEKYNLEHHIINIGFKNLSQDIENIILNYGEPYSDSSAIPSYYVSKAAKQHLTVILNGDGADELFGGYRRYIPFQKWDFFKKNKIVDNISNIALKVLPTSHNKKSKYNKIYRTLSLSTYNSSNVYWSATNDTFIGHFHEFHNQKSEFEDIERILEETEEMNGVDRLLQLDFNVTLPGILLVKMDIATMAHSLEGRSPFMSKSVMEVAAQIDHTLKVHNGKTKFILRELAKKYLPPTLITQPKRGFEIPLKKWVDDELKDVIHGYLNSANAYYGDFIDKKFVKDVLDNKITIPAEKRAKMLYKLMALEIWKKDQY